MAGNSNSGRRATPANVHLLRGNPSKKSAAELAAAGAAGLNVEAEAPKCPAFLTTEAKAEWKRIVGDLVSLGVVAKIDRAELAVYCQAWADWMKAREMIKTLGDSGYMDFGARARWSTTSRSSVSGRRPVSPSTTWVCGTGVM